MLTNCWPFSLKNISGFRMALSDVQEAGLRPEWIKFICQDCARQLGISVYREHYILDSIFLIFNGPRISIVKFFKGPDAVNNWKSCLRWYWLPFLTQHVHWVTVAYTSLATYFQFCVYQKVWCNLRCPECPAIWRKYYRYKMNSAIHGQRIQAFVLDSLQLSKFNINHLLLSLRKSPFVDAIHV